MAQQQANHLDGWRGQTVPVGARLTHQLAELRVGLELPKQARLPVIGPVADVGREERAFAVAVLGNLLVQPPHGILSGERRYLESAKGGIPEPVHHRSDRVDAVGAYRQRCFQDPVRSLLQPVVPLALPSLSRCPSRWASQGEVRSWASRSKGRPPRDAAGGIEWKDGPCARPIQRCRDARFGRREIDQRELGELSTDFARPVPLSRHGLTVRRTGGHQS